MDVLISWSKPQSRTIAGWFHAWLPQVMPNLAPWMSDLDIDKGTEWFSELHGFLSEAKLCIIFLTTENVRSPWLYYEAGAIGAKGSHVRVCPFLVGVLPGMLSDGPLGKFQCTLPTKDDSWLLIRSLNRALDASRRLDEEHLRTNFDTHWQAFADIVASTLESDNSEPNEFIATSADELAGITLSSEGRALLVGAAEDRHGSVLISNSNHGRAFYANNKLLNEPGNARSEAKWRAAWNQLIRAGLFEAESPGATVFVLSDKGYQVAERLDVAAKGAEAAPTRDLDDNDVVSLLEAFLADKRSSLDTETFVFDEVDRASQLPPGSAAKFLEKAAAKWNYLPARKGKNTITFMQNSGVPTAYNPSPSDYRARSW